MQVVICWNKVGPSPLQNCSRCDIESWAQSASERRQAWKSLVQFEVSAGGRGRIAGLEIFGRSTRPAKQYLGVGIAIRVSKVTLPVPPRQ